MFLLPLPIEEAVTVALTQFPKGYTYPPEIT
jgi:hypothetical protein